MSFDSRILIVEDDPMARELLMEMLGSAGYTHLASATDGPDALAQVAEQPPDGRM